MPRRALGGRPRKQRQAVADIALCDTSHSTRLFPTLPQLWDFEYSTRGGPAVALSQAEYYERVRGEIATKPDLWPLDAVGNHILAMRRGRLGPAQPAPGR